MTRHATGGVPPESRGAATGTDEATTSSGGSPTAARTGRTTNVKRAASRMAAGLTALTARAARRAKPAVVGVVAATVAATLGVQPVLAVPAAAGVECVAVSDDQATALKVAQACDRDVEVRTERTSWTTAYATPSGTIRIESTALAERALVDGAWMPVDPRVVTGNSGDGRLEVAVSPNELTFSDGTPGQALASMTR
ncbi:hypothetical protein, partial [Myceligenerans halotolerans]